MRMPPALTFVLTLKPQATFWLGFAWFAATITTHASLHVGLDLEATSNFLVVVMVNVTGLDAALDLEATSHRLIVIANENASLDVRFDLHIRPFLFEIDVERRRRNLGFEADSPRPSLIEASTRGEN